MLKASYIFYTIKYARAYVSVHNTPDNENIVLPRGKGAAVGVTNIRATSHIDSESPSLDTEVLYAGLAPSRNHL
jgi:hypothetical protein